MLLSTPDCIDSSPSPGVSRVPPHRRPRPGIRAAVAVLLALWGWAGTSVAAPPFAQTGERLAEVLQRLSREHGLSIVFSDRLVTHAMRVGAAPNAASAATALDQLLAQHRLACRRLGDDCVVVSTQPSEGLHVGAGLTSQPAPEPPRRLPALEVLPGSYPLLSGSGTYLDRDEIAAMPHFSDDVYRMLRSLPGIGAQDLAAPLHVRGGRTDELLVLLDGMALRRPYHLPNLQNPLTVLDPNLLGGLDFYTAGWPARLGGRTSAVIDMSSRKPAPGLSRAVGITGLNAFAHLGWSDASDRRSLLAGMRPGYLDLVLEFVDPNGKIDASYFDTYSVYRQSVNADNELSAHVLHAFDDVRFTGNDARDFSQARTRSTALWLRWLGSYGADWTSSVMLSHETDALRRQALEVDLDGSNASADDDRDLHGWQLQGWLQRSDEHGSWEFGAHWQDERTDFDYLSVDGRYRYFGAPSNAPLIRSAQLRASQRRTSLWLEREQQFGARWAARLALRYDDLQDSNGPPSLATLPAASLSYRLSERSGLGLALGRHWQAQRSDEIGVEDGQLQPFEPEIARHTALSYRYAQDDFRWRIELFDKHYSDPRSYFENRLNPFELLAESNDDRSRVDPELAYSRGLEVGVSREIRGGRVYASYVYTRARERIAGVWSPRSWEQPHALQLGLDAGLGDRWRLGANLFARSGWAYSQPVFAGFDAAGRPRLEFGPRNSERYPAYINLSARLSRQYRLADSDLEVYFEMLNLLNRENPCCIDRIVLTQSAEGSFELTTERQKGIPLLPSLGVTWKF